MFRSNTRLDKLVRAALSTMYQHLGFCKDGRYVFTVHLDCADYYTERAGSRAGWSSSACHFPSQTIFN